MGVHLEKLSDLDDHIITEEEAQRVLKIAEEWGYSTSRVIERWGQGEDLREIVREVVKNLYREHEKRLLFAGYPYNERFRELQLDVYAAVGIEPPRAPSSGVGHGG